MDNKEGAAALERVYKDIAGQSTGPLPHVNVSLLAPTCWPLGWPRSAGPAAPPCRLGRRTRLCCCLCKPTQSCCWAAFIRTCHRTRRSICSRKQ